jgi:PAS domain S-box-containing protein
MILDFVKQFVAGQDPSLQFTTTTSSKAALDTLHTQTYDCILLDYKMPEMNGIELAQKIRETNKTPIILYTGQGSEEVAEQAYAAGIDDYIRKEAHPAHYQVLARRIRHVIEKHHTDELYRTLVESCPDGCSISRENTFIYTNHVLANLFGFKEPSDVNGKNYLQWLVEEDRQTIINRNRRFEHGETTTEIINYRLRKPSGDVRFIESHGRSVFFEGAPATLAFTRDITHTRKIEEELRDSNERYRAISHRLTSFMNSATDEFVIYDKDLNLIDANDLWLKNHKTNRAEAIGKNARELHPRPIEDKIAEYLQVMRTGEPISYEAVTESFPGNTHQQMIRAFKVGEGVGAILVDVTNFKQMEKALVESEEKYRLLSENARDIIFRYSFTKGFEYVNKAVTKVLGYTLDEIRVSPLLDFNVPIEEEEKLSNLIEKIKTGQIVDSPFRLRFRHKTGHFVTLEFSLQPIVGKDGALESVEGIARDISQSVVYEKKLEALHSHAEAIAQAGYVEEICKATLDIIESVLGFHLLAFMVVSEDGLIAIESRKNRPLGRALPLNGKGISVRAAREKLPMRVADVRLDPDFVKSSTDSLSELAVPVVLEGETVFVINLESTNLNAFTEEDQSLVEILAEHISSAVKKLRLLENERSNREKLEALHHHAVELSSLDNIKEIAKFTLETVDTILGHSYGGFAVVNNERLEFVQSIGIELSRIQPIPIDGKGVTARTVRNGETQYVPDVRLDADYFPDGDGKTQSELDVPIKIDGKTIAVINLESNRLDSYTTEDKRIVEVLAEHVALAIKKLKLLESERQNTTRLEALHNHAVKLSEKEGIDEIASFTLDTIGKILGYSQSAFITIEGNKVRYLHLKDVDPNVLPEMNLEGPGITVRAIKTGKTQLIPDTRNDPDYVKDTNGENRSELDVPIKVDDRVVALINLEDKQPNAFNESDRHIIEILSEHVALAIKRLRLLENERSNAEKLEALNRRAAHLDQSQSVIEAIERACSILNEDFGYNWVGVGRVDEDAIRYVKYIGVTLSGNDLIPFSKNTVTVRAVTTGETQLVRDTTKDTNYILLALVEKPYLSELVVPVKVRGRIEYVLNIESFELDGFSDEARRQIELLALHLGSAFELIRERERLAALHKHAPQIARAKDINEIAQLVLATAGAVFHFPIAGLHVIRGSVIELVFVPGFTENGSFTQTIDGPGLIPYTVREGKSIRIDDVRLNEHYVKGPIGEEVRLSELVVPVKLGDKVIAVINLENSRLAAFTEEDQRMAELLALHVGTAMELIEEKRQIKEQQMAETRELLEGANRISSMVRHDLRGPLQSIKNATFLAEQQPEKSKEMLDAIDKSVDYATKILDDLRNSTSPIKLAKAVTNVNDLVEQSIASASIPGDINVHKSYSEGFIAASLDSTRIRRALDNLIKNAVEAMPRGGDLTVAVKKEGETVQIDVADTGVGIPKEVMESLFRPFFTTKPRGTGLGLAVCRQAVEAHGGTITLTSEPNKGTTFTIRLPLKG